MSSGRTAARASCVWGLPFSGRPSLHGRPASSSSSYSSLLHSSSTKSFSSYSSSSFASLLTHSCAASTFAKRSSSSSSFSSFSSSSSSVFSFSLPTHRSLSSSLRHFSTPSTSSSLFPRNLSLQSTHCAVSASKSGRSASRWWRWGFSPTTTTTTTTKLAMAFHGSAFFLLCAEGVLRREEMAVKRQRPLPPPVVAVPPSQASTAGVVVQPESRLKVLIMCLAGAIVGLVSGFIIRQIGTYCLIAVSLELLTLGVLLATGSISQEKAGQVLQYTAPPVIWLGQTVYKTFMWQWDSTFALSSVFYKLCFVGCFYLAVRYGDYATVTTEQR
ncbi:hypothetical protein QOT17_014330 [Balamuthia mandrillaris]